MAEVEALNAAKQAQEAKMAKAVEALAKKAARFQSFRGTATQAVDDAESDRRAKQQALPREKGTGFYEMLVRQAPLRPGRVNPDIASGGC